VYNVRQNFCRTFYFRMSQLTLRQLFDQFPFPFTGALDDRPIRGVCADNRRLNPGEVFVAIPGLTVDAHRFIPDAVRRGAAAVVGSQAGGPPVDDLPVPYIRLENPRQALAHLAAAWYGFPARKLTMIGVTGTDGKTTTTNLIYHILQRAGLQVGLISTVNAVIGGQVLDTGFHVTTPEALDVQHYLAQMVSAGLTHAVLETTSHGWAQYRVDACEFDIAAVTNITHEHLDLHGSYANYRAAKARLFASLGETAPKPGGVAPVAVLNRTDTSYEFLSGVVDAFPHVCRLDYGLETGARGARFYAQDIHQDVRGLCFSARLPDGSSLPIQVSLYGMFNVSNLLAALAVTVGGLGIDPQTAAQALADFPSIPGRMQRIDLGQNFSALVDFAHTPNALRVALQTARSLTSGRVIAVFGSAGLRDRQKRRMMAETSAELADITVLTAEDPRTESLEAILDEMLRAAVGRGAVEGKSVLCVPDRGDALRKAVELAQPGDLVIACGKGHEQSMCFGETEYPWDERTALQAALAERLGVPGPAMPRLPTASGGMD
jgi:UDP-N-acetylmuramoyl-L-alanyl-D-glutamate--2,6-diaminopimelate ligase